MINHNYMIKGTKNMTINNSSTGNNDSPENNYKKISTRIVHELNDLRILFVKEESINKQTVLDNLVTQVKQKVHNTSNDLTQSNTNDYITTPMTFDAWYRQSHSCFYDLPTTFYQSINVGDYNTDGQKIINNLNDMQLSDNYDTYSYITLDQSYVNDCQSYCIYPSSDSQLTYSYFAILCDLKQRFGTINKYFDKLLHIKQHIRNYYGWTQQHVYDLQKFAKYIKSTNLLNNNKFMLFIIDLFNVYQGFDSHSTNIVDRYINLYPHYRRTENNPLDNTSYNNLYFQLIANNDKDIALLMIFIMLEYNTYDTSIVNIMYHQ